MVSLAIIPARGGSKGLPGKNTRAICGRPLIAWTIRAALESRCFEQVVVSTDDTEIARIAVESGALVPFRRPEHLAGDASTTLDVVEHALACLDPANSSGSFAVLQPTSPLRTHRHIQEACQLFTGPGKAAVVSVMAAKPLSWHYTVDEEGRLQPLARGALPQRRQDEPALVRPNGAIYISTIRSLRETASFIPPRASAYEMDAISSIDIDTIADFNMAEALLARQIAGA